MNKPDYAYVTAAIDHFAQLCCSPELTAYPARLAGVDVVVLGRRQPGSRDGLWDVAPYMVIVTDELAEKFDLSPARA